MKGILIVSKNDLIDKPELFETLSAQSEKVVKASEGICFHSRDGSLMNMICALLDEEILYRLELASQPVSGENK